MAKNDHGNPLDGGWGWIIVLGAFVNTMFQVGTHKALGVFVPEFAEGLNLSVGAVGTICGVAVGLKCLLGFGLGITFAVIPLILKDYFHKRYSLATGLASSGAAIGMVIFPPAMEILIDTFGWRNALFLLGASCFNICAAGALFRPVNSSPKSHCIDSALISLLAGISIGSPPPVMIVILKELTCESKREDFTGAIGLHYMCVGIGFFAGGPIAGNMIFVTSTQGVPEKNTS
ncbi:monocarboxylate transporter 12-like [Amphiura filiformis]|uniref:monocarboxylate transporter 12-like n=1 Tax=Amphiura filiformis TaxID=82378 RepID=UPI003B223487